MVLDPAKVVSAETLPTVSSVQLTGISPSWPAKGSSGNSMLKYSFQRHSNMPISEEEIAELIEAFFDTYQNSIKFVPPISCEHRIFLEGLKGEVYPIKSDPISEVKQSLKDLFACLTADQPLTQQIVHSKIHATTNYKGTGVNAKLSITPFQLDLLQFYKVDKDTAPSAPSKCPNEDEFKNIAEQCFLKHMKEHQGWFESTLLANVYSDKPIIGAESTTQNSAPKPDAGGMG